MKVGFAGRVAAPSDEVMTGEPSHASEAVAAVHTGEAGQLIGVTCVAQVMAGAVTSTTTMVRLHDEALPEQSVAVQVLVME